MVGTEDVSYPFPAWPKRSFYGTVNTSGKEAGRQMRKISFLIMFLAFMAILAGCGKDSTVGDGAGEATRVTATFNEEVAKSLDIADPRDFEEARRGFIARPAGKIMTAKGDVVIDFDAFNFVEGKAPVAVNPSLWRHAILNAQVGLFKVTDGIYQIRGFDIGNMTLIEGNAGWIVVDPLTCRETGAAAIAFARKHLGDKPVSAIIFTHSHGDHFGGVLGVISPQEASRRKVPVIVPDGFVEEATSEYIMVGVAMVRRSMYQFGKNLERSPRGLVDTGLGKNVAYGNFGILQPTRIIRQPRESLVIDGVPFVFFNVPNTEAPAEMTFLLPGRKAYCGAEILQHTIHNLLPVRGAKVRDSLRWATYLDQALEQTADAEVFFAQHNWPIWGRARIAEFITKHRDVYKYTHDQTVRLINAGYTPREIADRIKLPRSLETYLASRGYYGDLRHNVKAVYQFYMGFYDGNPAHLNPLPPEESARRYIALIGGADRAIAAAQDAFDKGDYRWTAELLNQVVFAEPGNRPAARLLARTYDQMGYMSEAATWRNSYLTAAAELRNGPPKTGVDRSYAIDMLMQTPVEYFLDAMAASLNGPDAEGKNLRINLVFSDTRESFVLWIENAVLHHKKAAPSATANATLTLTKEIFIRMVAGTAGVRDTLMSKDFRITGSRIDLIRFFSLIEKAPGTFPIVTP
ncbi:MAG TPA: alkyl sulfatase dimerization domain-containing protein [Syntrophales bacterium]|nr:alkyl sulfatase dimerization domain-containing protein [Syntrophales bacterium]